MGGQRSLGCRGGAAGGLGIDARRVVCGGGGRVLTVLARLHIGSCCPRNTPSALRRKTEYQSTTICLVRQSWQKLELSRAARWARPHSGLSLPKVPQQSTTASSISISLCPPLPFTTLFFQLAHGTRLIRSVVSESAHWQFIVPACSRMQAWKLEPLIRLAGARSGCLGSRRQPHAHVMLEG